MTMSEQEIIDNWINMRQQPAQLATQDAYWQHYYIQAAIAAMPIVVDDGYNVRNKQHLIAKYAVELADALIEELQKKIRQND